MRYATQCTAAQRRAENTLIRRALKVLEDRLEYEKIMLNNSVSVRQFLTLRLAQLEHEIFVALWVDSQHRLIEFEELFRGTLTQTSVFPREIVKAALANNAAGVIFAHNHPSGVTIPSSDDKALTSNLREVLGLIDVRVLDHFIIGGASKPLSFAEHGLL